MAYGDTFHPAGTSRDVKVRGPLWVGVWTLVTLGIYGIYWFYDSAKDLSEYGKAKGYDLGQNPTTSLLAVLMGWVLLFVPTIIALYRFTKRVQQAQPLAGTSEQLNGWLALVLILVFSPAYGAYVQAELNKAWAAEGGPVPKRDDMPQHLESGPSGAARSGTEETSESSEADWARSGRRPPGPDVDVEDDDWPHP
jgi:hypothetical protein